MKIPFFHQKPNQDTPKNIIEDTEFQSTAGDDFIDTIALKERITRKEDLIPAKKREEENPELFKTSLTEGEYSYLKNAIIRAKYGANRATLESQFEEYTNKVAHFKTIVNSLTEISAITIENRLATQKTELTKLTLEEQKLRSELEKLVIELRSSIKIIQEASVASIHIDVKERASFAEEDGESIWEKRHRKK